MALNARVSINKDYLCALFNSYYPFIIHLSFIPITNKTNRK